MKTTTTIIAAIFAFVMLSSLAFAAVDVSYATYSGLYSTNGAFTTSTTPVNDVNVIGFVCADSSCSTVSGSLWNGDVLNTGSDNTITLQYPTTLQSQYGYAVFYYKAGSIAWVQRPNWAGTGTVPGVDSKYISKVETCRSPIDSFAVINDVYPNQPIMVDISTSLDANTSSPLMWNSIAGYHPSQLAADAKTNITVTLTISNSAGTAVNTQQKTVLVDPSSSQRVMFDYIPTIVDRYTARVTTTVTDPKCLSSDAEFSQKSFNVIAQGPTNQCYTLLNNLNVQPSNQTVGQPVAITFDKISNAYNSQGQLSTLGTAANIVVTQNGQTVSSQQLVIGPNANTVAPQGASAQFTPQSAGYYTVSVSGFSQNCPYTTSTADTVSQSFYAYSPFVPNNNTNTTNTTNTTTNQAPVWLNIPGVTLQQNSGAHANLFNLNLYVIDPDSNALTYNVVSSSNPAVATCSATLLTGFVSCTAPVGGPVGTTTITVLANDGQVTSTSSFVVTVLAVVNPNNSCTGPNGVTIAHTASATYFQSATVPFGQTCVSEARTCSNGVLSGTFTQATCTVQPQQPTSSCVGPNGVNITSGSSATYFQSATVPFGNVCTSEVRSCNNGALSGSFTQATCTVQPQQPAQSCVGPNGVNITNGSSANYYQFATVPSGQTCVGEVRTCNNGVLSGSFTQATCTQLPAPVSCTGPDGLVIASGSSQTYFQSVAVTVGNVCTSEVRSCNNGALSGSYQFNSCIVGPNTAPIWVTEPVLNINRNAAVGATDLGPYTFDPDVPPQVLTFSLVSFLDVSENNNAISGCTVHPTGSLFCWTNHGQDGKVTLNISVTDGIATAYTQATVIVGIDKTPSRKKTDNGLMIMQFHVPEYRMDELANGRVPISVGLKNEGRRLKDVKVTATILETGARTTMDTFNLGAETQNVQLYVPLDTTLKPGVYTVRLTISDTETGINRIEHRDLIIYP